uniref:Uncharacterized protein n=1 Tax=Acanthochromis polyacanthus TaxID=80966 RepID=A0A3Q1F310_9TELE
KDISKSVKNRSRSVSGAADTSISEATGGRMMDGVRVFLVYLCSAACLCIHICVCLCIHACKCLCLERVCDSVGLFPIKSVCACFGSARPGPKPNPSVSWASVLDGSNRRRGPSHRVQPDR